MITSKKRIIYVEGKPIDIGKMRLTEWIDPTSWGGAAIEQIGFNRFFEKARSNPKWLEYASRLGFDNFLVSEMWSAVNIEIAYRLDTDIFKREDFWELPSECWTVKKGDCEDTTFLLSSAIERGVYTSKDRTRYFAVIGYYKQPAEIYGHAWILWRNDYLKKYVVLETTYDKEWPSPFYWIGWNPDSYIPCVVFNRNYYGTVLQPQIQKDLGLSESYVKGYEQYIKNMIRYVEVGIPVRESFMHKTARPVRIELKDIEVML